LTFGLKVNDYSDAQNSSVKRLVCVNICASVRQWPTSPYTVGGWGRYRWRGRL